MKIYALHLPQFHEIPENNKWWGNGFTEWVNVKKARPLFENHDQPKVPLGKNYYDLVKSDSLFEQSKIAKKYNVSGFCFYHYWFKGKLLLEKPTENLLTDKRIDIEFFFSWANEPWTRSWDGKSGEILINQDYGKTSDWIRHINYLIPFFKDARYKKINNKPIFLIYKPSVIRDLPLMLKEWNKILINHGFDGVHLINTLRGINDDKRDHLFENNFQFEPSYSTRTNNPELKYKRLNRIIRAIIPNCKSAPSLYDINKIYMRSVSAVPKSSKKTFNGALIDWDNSARRKNSSTIFHGFNTEAFKDYLYEKIQISKKKYDNRLLIINAWNEWAEGAFIEPDEKYGYKKLEIISSLIKDNKP